ncbi:MAG: ABC transporter ATP-binding protein [Anaerolineaceae bacterium]|nr:ABC transporter ATP-binding protein [Anaerolineaceae bacterium]
MSSYKNNPSLKLFTFYLAPHWKRLCILALFLFVDIALQLSIPQFMKNYIDSAQNGAVLEKTTRFAILFISAAILQQFTFIIAIFFSENIGWNITNKIRMDLAAHCLDLDMTFHNIHTPGELIERIDADITILAEFFSQFIIVVAGNSLLYLGVLILMFQEDWRIGLSLSIFSGLLLLLMIRFQNVAVGYWSKERKASAKLFSFLEERLSGTIDIRSNGAVQYVMHLFYQLTQAYIKKAMKASMTANRIMSSIIFLYALVIALSLGVGLYLFEHQWITIGSVYITFHYTAMLERPLRQLARQFQEFQRAGAGISRIQEILSIDKKIKNSGTYLQTNLSGAISIEFQNITFSYDDQPIKEEEFPGKTENETVLNKINFSLKPGSTLGLLGRTGSGKTTISRLILRLFEPDEGRIIFVDSNSGKSIDIRSIPLSNLRQKIGMVTQNIQIFQGSIRENLTFFNPEIKDETILDSLNELGLSPWLQSYPQGLDTILNSGAESLSIGEGQLLAFTRIFLKNPDLIILDEASAHLDPVTEKLIDKAVNRLTYGKTTIIIAHRLSTIQRANEILILEKGKVLEFGSKDFLLQDNNSHFHQLMQSGLEEVLA